MPPRTLPVTIQIGHGTAIVVGHIDVPILSSPAGQHAAGLWQVDCHVDHPELWRRIVNMLRGAADQVEEGLVGNGD